MRYPKQVRNPRQDVTVQIGEPRINEDGERVYGQEKQLKAYVQLSAYETLTADKRLIKLSGKALFDGDIAPEEKQISHGTMVFNGVKYEIYRGQKNYNPDGSINYTKLELI